MELKKNQYLIDGIPVLQLVKKYDSPLYIYESARMIEQYSALLMLLSVPG